MKYNHYYFGRIFINYYHEIYRKKREFKILRYSNPFILVFEFKLRKFAFDIGYKQPKP